MLHFERREDESGAGEEFQWADSPQLTPVSLTVKLTSSSLLSPPAQPQLGTKQTKLASSSDIDQLTSSSSENNCQVYQAGQQTKQHRWREGHGRRYWNVIIIL